MDGGVNEGLKAVGQENVVENENRILALIHENTKYSAAQMADRLGMTSRTVQRYIKHLQEKNKIERIGPAKGGHWKINKKN